MGKILSMDISYLDHFGSKEIKNKSLISILSDIKNGKYRELITPLSILYKEEKYDLYKKKKSTLPVVIFGGIFENGRKLENLKTYNSLLVLDIDKLNQEELKKTKEILLNDEYVFSFWDSPSKAGIKGLIYLRYDFQDNDYSLFHKSAFSQIKEHFKKKDIELDDSGKDIPRLCFVSNDKDLVLKKELHPFLVKKEKINVKKRVNSNKIAEKKVPKDLLYNPLGKNKRKNRYIINLIIKFLTKKSLSITSSYDEWYRVAFAISHSFTYEVGEKYFLKICKLYKGKFEAEECKKLLKNCYLSSNEKILLDKESSFKTIVYFAEKKGFQYPKKRAEQK
jgi:hypothetical protein